MIWTSGELITGEKYIATEAGPYSMMVSGDDEQGYSWSLVDVNLEPVASGEAETEWEGQRSVLHALERIENATLPGIIAMKIRSRARWWRR